MSEQQIKVVIFDMGGVILRTEDPSPRIRLAEQLGFAREEMEMLVFASESAITAETGAIPTGEHWRQVCEAVGWPTSEAKEFERLWFSGDRFDLELIDFIRSLRPKYNTALLSNAWDETRQMVTGIYDFTDAFDLVVFSAEVKLRKPDAAIFQLILDHFGVQPQEAVFLDDFEPNIAGARAAGLHAIQFRNSAQARADLVSLLNR